MRVILTKAKMKNLLPIICSIPTLLLWTLFIVTRLFGYIEEPDILMYVPALSFLLFTVCVAMAFVKPEVKEWRIAAVVTGIPFGLVVLLIIFFSLMGYNG